MQEFYLMTLGGAIGMCLFALLQHLLRPQELQTEVSEEFDPDLTQEELASEILDLIFDEWARAKEIFPPFNSSHEGWGILAEEQHELMLEVFKNGAKHPERDANMRKEAIQVAAMEVRFVAECCGIDSGNEDSETIARVEIPGLDPDRFVSDWQKVGQDLARAVNVPSGDLVRLVNGKDDPGIRIPIDELGGPRSALNIGSRVRVVDVDHPFFKQICTIVEIPPDGNPILDVNNASCAADPRGLRAV